MRGDASQRGFWRLARVEKLIHGIDGQVRGAVIRVSRGNKKPTILRCPVTHQWLMGPQAVSVQQNQLHYQKAHNQLRIHSPSLIDLGELLLKGQENGCKPSLLINLNNHLLYCVI